MTDDERLEEIRRRCEAATAGPWDWIYTGGEQHEIRMPSSMNKAVYPPQHKIEYFHGLYSEDGEPFEEAQSNAEFIAHSREDIPWLLKRDEQWFYKWKTAVDTMSNYVAKVTELETLLEAAKQERDKLMAAIPGAWKEKADFVYDANDGQPVEKSNE